MPSTENIQALFDGERVDVEAVAPTVWARLRAIARDLMRRERRDHTLQPTALAHECYIRLREMESLEIRDAEIFEHLVRKIQKNVLLRHAEMKRAKKRGGGKRRVPLSDSLPGVATDPAIVLDLDVALDRLQAEFPVYRAVIDQQFFRNWTIDQIAADLGRSRRMAQYTVRAALMKLAEYLGA